jgi:hypothetical protein
MDSIFLHLQNFTVVSYGAFCIVLMSFFIEFKSNSPYKSLLLSNIGFGIYNFTLLTCSEIDFPIYFILLSFLICSWFFVLKNIEEEEDEDKGFLRNYHNDSIIGFSDAEDENNDGFPSLEKEHLTNFINVFSNQLSKILENKLVLFVMRFFKNEVAYYKHPQRKFVHAFTYLILITILVSFFLV